MTAQQKHFTYWIKKIVKKKPSEEKGVAGTETLNDLANLAASEFIFSSDN